MTPTEFEKLIKRIHDVLVQDYGDVKWNDKIPDPDNPKQLRQIDITVRINDKLIIIECRYHQKRQDVKWIEELKGRKDSLNVDEIIAVSSSGFTEGAMKKANRFGIYLCSLTAKNVNLLEDDIEPTIITFQYKQFSNLKITFILNQDFYEPNKIINSFKVREKLHHEIFYKLNYQLAEKIHYKYHFQENFNPMSFSEKIDYPNLVLAGHRIKGFFIEGEFKLVNKEIPSPPMFKFNNMNSNESLIATVERLNTGAIEIIKTVSKFSSVKLDTSIIPMPPDNAVHSAIIFDKLPGSKTHPPKPYLKGKHELPFKLICDNYFFAVID